VTTFTHFTDPYRISNDQGSPFAPPYPGSKDDSYFQWNGALDGLDEADFAMLVRTIELVVQAGTFSRERLQIALRISPELTEKMTSSIEKLGVIAPGEPDQVRRVLINVLGLEPLLAKVLSGRQYVVGAFSSVR
jgi:hypothetical protein